MQSIAKRQLMYFRQIGHNPLIINTQPKLTINTPTLALNPRIESCDEIQMLIPRLKALQFPINILRIRQFFSMFHKLLAGVNMPIDGERAEAVGEREVVEGRGVLLQLA